MTGDLAGVEGVPALAGGSSPPSAAPAPTSVAVPPSAATLLNRCDAQLGEIGRRMHRFSWLRAPGAPIEQCLVVDAYYPGNRIVVICGSQTDEERALCQELIPTHGLRLLTLQPEQFTDDPAQTAQLLSEMLGRLAAARPRPQEPVRAYVAPPSAPRASASSTAAPASAPPTTPLGAASAAAQRARVSADPAASAAESGADERSAREQRERAGMVLGVSLLVVTVAELMIFVAILGFGDGHPLLAIGFALDASARVLGTIAFARDGDDDRAWGCVIIGSPAVVNSTLLGESTVSTEPAPLAGALGAIACALIVLWGLGSLAGI
jgi:hypothetical protein